MKKIITLLFMFYAFTAYAQTFYAKPAGSLTNTATWGTNTDGTGSAPSDFTNNSYTFRVTNANNTIDAVWNVSNLTVDYAGGLNVSFPTTISGTLTLTTGTINSGGNLTLNLNTGRVGGTGSGTIAGNMTVIKNATFNRYHYISSPLSTTFQEIADDVNSGYIFWYDETINNIDNKFGWTNITNLNSSTQLGLGYACFFPIATTIDINGTYNQNFQYNKTDFSFTYSGGNDPDSDGWHLVGNPFAAAIDWDDVDWYRKNIEDAVYYWDPQNNRYASYSEGVGTNDGTQYIPSMQAFWVHVGKKTGNTNAQTKGEMVFDKNVITTSNPSLWRTTADEYNYIRMTLQSGVYADETIIRIHDAATDTFDYDFDAYKLKNENQTPSFYSILDNIEYSINSIGDSFAIKEIPLSFDAAFAGEYQIIFNKDDFSSDEYDVILIDTVTNVEQEITSNQSYTFTTDQGENNKRFRIIMKWKGQITGIKKAVSNDITIRSSEGQVTINGDDISNVSIYNMSGREVYNGIGYDNFSYYLPQPGVYLIKVACNEHTHVQKIFVR